MREYEVVYIFRPDLEHEEVEERLDRYHDRLGDGEVTAVEHWGQRQLAYEIKDERKGYYAVVQFRAEPDALTDFEQGLRHDEDLLRHLIVLSEGELPIPPSQRGEDEDEDGESGDEADEDEAEADEEEPEEEESAGEEEPEDEEEEGDEEEDRDGDAEADGEDGTGDDESSSEDEGETAGEADEDASGDEPSEDEATDEEEEE